MLVVVGTAGASAWSAKASLGQARQGLQSVRSDPDPVGALPALEQARRHVADAERALDRLPVRVVAALPLVGRSFAAERAVAEVSREVLSAAAVAAARAPSLGTGDGGLDLGALAGLERDLTVPVQRARRALTALESTPTGLTPRPVRDAVRQAVAALSPAVAGLEDAQAGAQVARGLLGGQGPRRLLVALGNNAELRGSGGYVASFATGRAAGGRLSLEPLQDVVAVADPPQGAQRVPAPDDYVQDYGPLSGDTTQFRSWNMSPDFPASAVVGSRVAGALLGTAPDVVISLDVPAMTALARLGGGDLEVGNGRTVSPDELQQALLVDAYAQAGRESAAQEARRRELQTAATVAVTRLLGSDVAPADAVRTLAELARGRHLMVWSARPPEQVSLEQLGFAGAVRAPAGQDLLHVAVNNIGANKLDLYVDRAVELDAVVGEDSAQVVQRVRFTNRAPGGLVPYVAGYDRPGTVISRVELSLPADAVVESVRQDGGTAQGSIRRGTDRLRVATRVALSRGRSTALEVRYRVPLLAGTYRLSALAQPLASDATLALTVRPAPGLRLRDETGTVLTEQGLRRAGPFSAGQTLTISPVEKGWRDRLRQFWDEPLRLG